MLSKNLESKEKKQKKIIITRTDKAELEIMIKINRIWVKILIDDVSDRELIDSQLRRMLKAESQKKKQILITRNVKKQVIMKITNKTEKIRMIIRKHDELLIFNKIEMSKHKTLLEASWLKQHNSEIDWVMKEVKFTRCNCHEITIQITQSEERESWKLVRKQISKKLWKFKKIFMQLLEAEELLQQ